MARKVKNEFSGSLALPRTALVNYIPYSLSVLSWHLSRSKLWPEWLIHALNTNVKIC